MTDNPDIHLDSSNTIGTQEALPLEATNSGSTSIRLPSTPKQTSYLGVWATRIIFALALTSTITPACKCSDSTELSADVIKYAKELKKIQEAQEYFEENIKRLKSMEKRAIKNPWGVIKEIENTTKILEELIPALQSLGQSNIKVHPKLLLEAAWHINTTINLLNSRKMQDFHEGAKLAKKWRNSRRALNWILRNLGITDINGLIKLSSQLKKLKEVLATTIKAIDALSEPKVKEYSSEYTINKYLKHKPPKPPKNRGRVAGLQRELIEAGCLPLSGYDGVVGRGTKKAQKKYRMIGNCR